MRHIGAVLCVLLAIAGCASSKVWVRMDGSSSDPVQFEMDKGECQARGTATWGQSHGTGVERGAAGAGVFDGCMRGKGWMLVSKEYSKGEQRYRALMEAKPWGTDHPPGVTLAEIRAEMNSDPHCFTEHYPPSPEVLVCSWRDTNDKIVLKCAFRKKYPVGQSVSSSCSPPKDQLSGDEAAVDSSASGDGGSDQPGLNKLVSYEEWLNKRVDEYNTAQTPGDLTVAWGVMPECQSATAKEKLCHWRDRLLQQTADGGLYYATIDAVCSVPTDGSPMRCSWNPGVEPE